MTSDNWRSNAADPRNKYLVKFTDDDLDFIRQSELIDRHMMHLDQNEIWMYQRRLEHFIKINAPGVMSVRPLAMLRLLCGQARRCPSKDQL